MKIHGYCEHCRKIKLIPATSSAMVNVAMNRPVFGVCDSCREKELEEAKGRHPAYRRRTN